RRKPVGLAGGSTSTIPSEFLTFELYSPGFTNPIGPLSASNRAWLTNANIPANSGEETLVSPMRLADGRRRVRIAEDERHRLTLVDVGNESGAEADETGALGPANARVHNPTRARRQ